MPLTLLNSNNSGRFTISNVNGAGLLQFNSNTAVTPIATGSPWQQLNTITSYLRNYITDFRNPLFFNYRLDQNAYYIQDGGNDMFDTGNATAPWLRSGTNYVALTPTTIIPVPPAVPYSSQSATLTDTNYYYASFGYTQSAGTFPASQNIMYHPLTMFGARSGSGPIGWQKTGNIGADGAGSIRTGSIYTGSTVNGFTTYAYYRQTYGQGADPNICDVYMLFGHTNWNSNFGTVTWLASMSTQGQGGALYATGSASNLLAVTTLLSRSGSSAGAASLPISASDITTVVDNFALRIKQALSF
jgi:hypothetical protein